MWVEGRVLSRVRLEGGLAGFATGGVECNGHAQYLFLLLVLHKW